jgi:flavin-dependent dehydrogenase
MTELSSANVDVLVIGGGPAGASAAWALASAGVPVALAERSDYGRFRIGETLPPKVNVLLARLGLNASLGKAGHLPSPGVVALWGSDRPHENHFIFSPYGHGWHLDRRRFDESLAGLAAKAGAELIPKARAVSCERKSTGGWIVILTTPDSTITANARWVIDATGRSGWFTRLQGIAKHSYDRLIALVALLDDPARSDPRTFIEAMPDGWWYVSALPNNRAIAAYFTDSDLHDLHVGAAESLWRSRLGSSRLASERLLSTQRINGPRVVSCATTRASLAGGDGWLAVGDAARTIDPLSSQGISWAITAGCDAASVVLDVDPGPASARHETEWDERFLDYLVTRRNYYSSERRWTDAPFWRRRSVEPVPLP